MSQRSFLAAALFVLTAVSAMAQTRQTQVSDAWVRGTVAQQKTTGFFAQITAGSDSKLVAASSDVAGIVEIHEMKMDGGVMRMRAIDALPLPAGKTVKLEPGGYHVMLMDLKRTLAAGDSVLITLVLEGAGGKRETLDVKAAVRALGAPAGGHRH